MDRVYKKFDLSPYGPNLTDDFFPYFQPIFSFEQRRVIGYEVLARAKDRDGNIVSIGSLFDDPSIPEQVRQNIDYCIREDAVIRFKSKNLEGRSRLFINIYPHRMSLSEIGNGDPCAIIKLSATMTLIKHYGVQASAFILELSGFELEMNRETITDIIRCYRNEGFQISLDDYPVTERSISELPLLKPDYIKIDSTIFRKAAAHPDLRDLAARLKEAAHETNAMLLLKRVEKEGELYSILDGGTTNLQGNYLSDAVESFLEEEFMHDLIEKYDRHVDEKGAKSG
jgi:EAL domain-containing protein (putative c-di-GMP-specific phosphodiesterase class I)